jgi:hypothetical protein
MADPKFDDPIGTVTNFHDKALEEFKTWGPASPGPRSGRGMLDSFFEAVRIHYPEDCPPEILESPPCVGHTTPFEFGARRRT